MVKALTLFLILPALLFCTIEIKAQCTPGNAYSAPGFYQNGNYCFTRDSIEEVFWQFVNDSFYIFDGDTAFLDSVKIAYIYNLPCGLFWNTNKTGDSIPDVFYPGEHGCFTMFGAATDTTGYYPLDVFVYAWIGGSPTPILQGLYYLHPFSVMVIDRGSICPALDTSLPVDTATCLVDTSTPYSPYAGITDLVNPIGNIANYPNPFSETTEVVFSSNDSREIMFRVYDLVGRILYEERINAEPGTNSLFFDRRGIPAGVYFYYLGDTQNGATGKMMVMD